MREFEIDIQRTAGAPTEASVGIAIGSGETVFTRLLRQGANAPEDHLKAPPAQLAFWLTASLLIGAFCASLAATEGGGLRDGTWKLATVANRRL